MVLFFSLLLPFLQVFPSQWLHHSFYFEIHAANLGGIPKRHTVNPRNYIAHGGASWLSVDFPVLKDLGWANYYFSGIWSYLNIFKISVCKKNYILESWYILGKIYLRSTIWGRVSWSLSPKTFCCEIGKGRAQWSVRLVSAASVDPVVEIQNDMSRLKALRCLSHAEHRNQFYFYSFNSC